MVEHFHGKEGVSGSSPELGLLRKPATAGFFVATTPLSEPSESPLGNLLGNTLRPIALSWADDEKGRPEGRPEQKQGAWITAHRSDTLASSLPLRSSTTRLHANRVPVLRAAVTV